MRIPFWAAIIVIVMLIIVCCFLAEGAEQIPDNLAIRAIVGEASGEGYSGMLYVAIGLRNRGTLQGVYGLNAKHVDKEPQWVWKLAEKAWAESEYNRLHTGTHWESINFPVPKWAKDMKRVCRLKNHIFYKTAK